MVNSRTPEAGKWVEEFSNAIIVNAAEDYRKAYKTKCHLQEFACEFQLVIDELEDGDIHRLQYKDKWFKRNYRKYLRYKNALCTMEAVERFYHSSWFKQLTDIDGEWLFKELKKDVEG